MKRRFLPIRIRRASWSALGAALLALALALPAAAVTDLAPLPPLPPDQLCEEELKECVDLVWTGLQSCNSSCEQSFLACRKSCLLTGGGLSCFYGCVKEAKACGMGCAKTARAKKKGCYDTYHQCLLGPCDDGKPVICAMIPPACPLGTILAAQNGCWECVDPQTCAPPCEDWTVWDPELGACCPGAIWIADCWCGPGEQLVTWDEYDDNGCLLGHNCGCEPVCEEGTSWDEELGACCPDAIWIADCWCQPGQELVTWEEKDASGCLLGYNCACKGDPCDGFIPPCAKDGDCPKGMQCSFEGCNPSECFCSATSGGVICTDDCGGGQCVPGPGPCDDFVPPCSEDVDCPGGMYCSFKGCNPSYCFCDSVSGAVACSRDCGGGQCLPDPGLCDDFIPPCKEDADCPGDMECSFDGCNPSQCFCDPGSGLIACTKDCAGGKCVKPSDPCADFIPPCKKDGDCPGAMVCSFEGCNPSACGCDPITGAIICTADCGGGKCVDDLCEGFIPPCQTNADCPGELVCSFDGCNPSICGCDPATGDIICTADCGGGACVPPSDPCEGFIPPCQQSDDCPKGMVCSFEGCNPSICSCDPKTGLTMCTKDCAGGKCIEDPGLCDDFIPPCKKDADCPGEMVCSFFGCNPSACGCDPATGDIICTADCGGGACIDPVDLCEDFIPPCSKDADCPGDLVCSFDGCNPSACGCDPATGLTFCTADCGGGACVPAKPDLCEGFVPPCQSDADCAPGQACIQDGGCNPSICSCDPADGSIICTADCAGKVCVDVAEPCGCTQHSDCIKASPGCCPCSMGGQEVAVAKQCVDQLPGCPYEPWEVACPAVYLCTDAQPFCNAQGQCELTSGSGGPIQLDAIEK